jgi:hypothetical protein
VFDIEPNCHSRLPFPQELSVIVWVPDFEPFVDAERAAEFVAVSPRYLLDLARKGLLPAYPLGTGVRRVWRFKLSEIDAALSRQKKPVKTLPFEHNHSGSLPRENKEKS